jgi:transcriptional regulator with XRE-family HTH domain
MDKIKSLAEWMTDRDIGMEQLLEAAGLDRKVLSAIVNGRYTPSPQQRQRVAAALRVRPEQISWGHTASVEHIYGHGPQFGRSP